MVVGQMKFYYTIYMLQVTHFGLSWITTENSVFKQIIKRSELEEMTERCKEKDAHTDLERRNFEHAERKTN